MKWVVWERELPLTAMFAILAAMVHAGGMIGAAYDKPDIVKVLRACFMLILPVAVLPLLAGQKKKRSILSFNLRHDVGFPELEALLQQLHHGPELAEWLEALASSGLDSGVPLVVTIEGPPITQMVSQQAHQARKDEGLAPPLEAVNNTWEAVPPNPAPGAGDRSLRAVAVVHMVRGARGTCYLPGAGPAVHDGMTIAMVEVPHLQEPGLIVGPGVSEMEASRLSTELVTFLREALGAHAVCARPWSRGPAPFCKARMREAGLHMDRALSPPSMALFLGPFSSVGQYMRSLPLNARRSVRRHVARFERMGGRVEPLGSVGGAGPRLGAGEGPAAGAARAGGGLGVRLCELHHKLRGTAPPAPPSKEQGWGQWAAGAVLRLGAAALPSRRSRPPGRDMGALYAEAEPLPEALFHSLAAGGRGGVGGAALESAYSLVVTLGAWLDGELVGSMVLYHSRARRALSFRLCGLDPAPDVRASGAFVALLFGGVQYALMHGCHVVDMGPGCQLLKGQLGAVEVPADVFVEAATWRPALRLWGRGAAKTMRGTLAKELLKAPRGIPTQPSTAPRLGGGEGGAGYGNNPLYGPRRLAGGARPPPGLSKRTAKKEALRALKGKPPKAPLVAPWLGPAAIMAPPSAETSASATPFASPLRPVAGGGSEGWSTYNVPSPFRGGGSPGPGGGGGGGDGGGGEGVSWRGWGASAAVEGVGAVAAAAAVGLAAAAAATAEEGEDTGMESAEESGVDSSSPALESALDSVEEAPSSGAENEAQAEWGSQPPGSAGWVRGQVQTIEGKGRPPPADGGAGGARRPRGTDKSVEGQGASEDFEDAGGGA